VDREAEEGQQIKGDEMTLGDFMDVLGRLHKLTPAQRRAVAEVLAEPEEVQRPAAASEQPTASPVQKRPPRERYTIYQKAKFRSLANQWEPMADQQRQDAIDSLAGQYHRTPSQIERQIYYYRTGK
jgi:hypothetical protein